MLSLDLCMVSEFFFSALPLISCDILYSSAPAQRFKENDLKSHLSKYNFVINQYKNSIIFLALQKPLLLKIMSS